MSLEEYLTRKKLTICQFAKEVGISRQSIHFYLKGERLPSNKNARKIVKYSNYQISLDELWFHIDYREEVYDVL